MWRGFIDEITPDGAHLIFTDDDTLTITTIKEEYKGSGKVFGEHYTGPKIQSEIVAYVQSRVEALNAQETPISTGVFVDTSVASPAIDTKREAELALSRALSAYERASLVAQADPTFDISKYKLTVVQAQAAVEAASK